jgi:hypothetical protein
VNGVYDSMIRWSIRAVRYTRLTFDKVLSDRLNVMDATAIVMCRDNRLPLRVFNLFNPGDLVRIVRGEDVGTSSPPGLTREGDHARRLKKDATSRMQKCVLDVQADLKKLRTGRAHTSLIEH